MRLRTFYFDKKEKNADTNNILLLYIRFTFVDVKERKKAYIDIKRGSSVVETVPITESSIVRFSLMQEHYIRLDFVLAEPKHFAIGDYIEDEIFGRFYITKEQMPKDDNNGGVRYELRFDAEYYQWKNIKFAMVTTPEDGVKIRKEFIWSYTGTLEMMAEMLIDNLEVAGYKGWRYNIKDTATEAKETRCMTFNGTDIISALNNFCQYESGWNTEWWVEGKTIYFGKCEKGVAKDDTEDDTLDFEKDVNVQDMSIKKDQTTPFNKLYAFGGTSNIPLNYRKELILKITGKYPHDEHITDNIFHYSTDKKIEAEYFTQVSKLINVDTKTLGRRIGDTRAHWGSSYEAKDFDSADIWWEEDVEEEYWNAQQRMFYFESEVFTLTEKTKLDFTWKDITFNNILNGIYPTNGIGETFYVGAEIYLCNTDRSKPSEIITVPVTAWVDDEKTFAEAIRSRNLIINEGTKEIADLEPGDYYIRFNYRIVLPKGEILWDDTVEPHPYNGSLAVDAKLDGLFSIKNNSSQSPILAARYYVGEEWKTALIRFNPDHSEDIPDKYYFAVVDENGVKQEAPFFDVEKSEGVTNTFILEDNDSILIPLSYYTIEDLDKPSALARIGDKRLKIPKGEGGYDRDYRYKDGYIIKEGTENDMPIEEVIAFDKVYPNLKLKVTGVTTTKKQTVNTNETDGSKDVWKWDEYTIQVKTSDDEDFNFDDSFMLPNEELKVRFLTPSDIDETEDTNGYKLAGMTFGVRFNPISIGDKIPANSFTIVQNTDFGAALPSIDSLYPMVGDACEIIGWNVKALAATGVIATSEKRLLDKAIEYFKASQSGNFTFECTMFSQWCFSVYREKYPYSYLYDIDEEQLLESAGKMLMVKSGEDMYLLPMEGRKVRIKHKALAEDKVSRVIAYEFKLDKPYDSPRYTIGETEPYSRLKRIEKEITKIS